MICTLIGGTQSLFYKLQIMSHYFINVYLFIKYIRIIQNLNMINNNGPNSKADIPVQKIIVVRFRRGKSRIQKNNLNHTRIGTSPLVLRLRIISTFQVRGN